MLSAISKGLSANHDTTILTLDDPLARDLTLYDFAGQGVRFEFIAFGKLPLREYFPYKLYSFLYKYVLPQNRLTSSLYGKSSFPTPHRKKLVEAIGHGKYDVVVGVHAFRSLDLAAIAGQVDASLIGWLHTSYDGFFNTPGLYLWRQKTQFRYAMPLLDAVVVLTHSDKQLYKKEMGLDTTVIYNPLNELPAYNYRGITKKFLAVGRMSRLTKGFDILIKAFAIYAKKDKEWLLNIVGEGPEEGYLRGLIEEFHLEDRVFIRPFTKEIQEYYSTSGVFILSSRWEGFGLVLVEAMAYGLPVIASDLPAVKEILSGKRNALMFNNGSVEELAARMFEMTNYRNLKMMGEESYKTARQFKPGPILRQWEELLEAYRPQSPDNGHPR